MPPAGCLAHSYLQECKKVGVAPNNNAYNFFRDMNEEDEMLSIRWKRARRRVLAIWNLHASCVCSSNCQLTTRSLTPVLKCLRCEPATNILRLRLVHCQLDDSCMPSLSTALQHCTFLEEVTLSQNSLGPQVGRRPARLAPHPPPHPPRS
jgi:hypothetical protein